MNLENLKIKELRQKLNFSQAEFSNEIGIKQGSYSDIERGKIGISGEILKILIKKYRISPIWLYEGIGDVFLTPNMTPKLTPNNQKSEDLEDESNYVEVSLYDAVAYGGDLRKGKAFDETITEIGTLKLSQQFKGATGAMFVRDDSMHPLYPNSCVVIFKTVSDMSIILYGRDYIIETEDFRVVKRILKGKEKDILIATSINTEMWEQGEYAGTLIYEPFEIPKRKLLKMDLVLGKL